jgi:hypothetical protein
MRPIRTVRIVIGLDRDAVVSFEYIFICRIGGLIGRYEISRFWSCTWGCRGNRSQPMVRKCLPWPRRLCYPKASENTSSLKPTRIVLPTRIVGARRFPVGPSMASMSSSSMGTATENSSTFLPLAATILVTVSSRFLASSACNFLLAGIGSTISILLASRNLDALSQLLQPLRL